jgi:Caspase domain
MPTTHALLIAGGHYHDSRVPGLQAPQNDLRLMVSLLLWRYAIPSQNILVVGAKPGSLEPGLSYIATSATRQAILGGLKALSERVKRDDHVIGYYSGHGARIANVVATRSTDPLEWNALVPTDYEPYTGKNLVLEHELWATMEALPTANQTWVMDCCFSGGFGSKSALPVKVDSWPVEHASKALMHDFRPQQMHDTFPKPPQLRLDPTVTKPAPFTLLAACQENESAEEARFLPWQGRPGCTVSEFTWALYHTLWQYQQPLTLPQLAERTRQRLRLRGRGQIPLVVVGKRRQVATTCLAPFPWTAPNPRLPVIANPSRLRVGRLAGIVSGSRGRAEGHLVHVGRVDWFEAQVNTPRNAPWITLI